MPDPLTMKVHNPKKPGDFMTINIEDYEPTKHKIWEGEEERLSEMLDEAEEAGKHPINDDEVAAEKSINDTRAYGGEGHGDHQPGMPVQPQSRPRRR